MVAARHHPLRIGAKDSSNTILLLTARVLSVLLIAQDISTSIHVTFIGTISSSSIPEKEALPVLTIRRPQ